MKFSEVIDASMEGKPISRTGWENNNYIFYDKDDNCFNVKEAPEYVPNKPEFEGFISYFDCLDNGDFFEDDWEIADEVL